MRGGGKVNDDEEIVGEAEEEETGAGDGDKDECGGKRGEGGEVVEEDER